MSNGQPHRSQIRVNSVHGFSSSPARYDVVHELFQLRLIGGPENLESVHSDNVICPGVTNVHGEPQGEPQLDLEKLFSLCWGTRDP